MKSSIHNTIKSWIGINAYRELVEWTRTNDIRHVNTVEMYMVDRKMEGEWKTKENTKVEKKQGNKCLCSTWSSGGWPDEGTGLAGD